MKSYAFVVALVAAGLTPLAAQAQEDAGQYDIQPYDSQPAVEDADAGVPQFEAVQEPVDAAAADPVVDPAAEPAVIETIPVAPIRQDKVAESLPQEPSATVIDEIVVTAQRRVERLQDVPVAITVINQAQLERANVTQITDLSRVAPSIEVNGQPGNADTRISIRGISTESFSVTAEQAVSIVVDGVVLGKTPAVSLFDVGRVEVLRGPQGTLFGKNASAGVISITTNAPDPGQFMIGGRADLGSDYDYRLLQASVNIPTSENSALRINAGQTYSSGFYHNNVRNEDSEQSIEGARARFLWDITPTLTLNLIADYEQQRMTEQMYLVYSRFVNKNSGEPMPIPGCGGVYASPDNRISCNKDPTFNDGKSWGASAQFNWLFGDDYNLTSISAYRRYEQYNEIDVDGLSGSYYKNANAFDNRVFSQELRIASPADRRLTYVAGLYYSDSHVPNDLDQTIGADMLASLGTGLLPVSLCTMLRICLGDIIGLYQPNQYVADIRSAAAFAQFTFQITDPLRFIAGARYTHDDVQMVSSSYLGVSSGLLPRPIVLPTSQALLGREIVNEVSWRTGLQYEFSRELMSYFTVSRGYKGPQIVFVPPNVIPGLNGLSVTLPTPAQINVVKPEYPMDYQLGLKASLLGGLIAINSAIFHTRIEDFQSSSFNGQGSFTPNNISSVVTQGVEIDLIGFFSENLMLSAGFAYNDVTYPKGYLVNCTQVGPNCPDTEEGTVQDIGGKQLVVAPKWKFTMSPEYSFGLPFDTRGFVSVDAVYRSKMSFSAADDTRTEVDGRTIIGARIGIRGPMDNWEISLFGRNLTDERNPAYMFAPFLLSSASAPNAETAGHALSTESFRFFGLTIGMRI